MKKHVYAIEYHIEDIHKIAVQLWQHFSAHKTWIFDGEMGSGKTTLIKAICLHLHVTDSISSPTFSLINEYKSATNGAIFHLDLYRVKDEAEALQAGVDECINSNAYCFIEWPEKAPGLLPEHVVKIKMHNKGAYTRMLSAELI